MQRMNVDIDPGTHDICVNHTVHYNIGLSDQIQIILPEHSEFPLVHKQNNLKNKAIKLQRVCNIMEFVISCLYISLEQIKQLNEI